MQIKQFEVVELKNRNRAIIKKVISDESYEVEIVDKSGKTISNKIISKNDIHKKIYSK